MSYFIYGVTYNHGHFAVDDVDSCDLNDETSKICAVIRYFGGGAVTVYEVNDKMDIEIYEFMHISDSSDIPVDNDSEL